MEANILPTKKKKEEKKEEEEKKKGGGGEEGGGHIASTNTQCLQHFGPEHL